MKPVKPIIGLTIGDVNGIGPEILLKIFSDNRMLERCAPIIYGSSRALLFYRSHFKLERFSFQAINHPSQRTADKLYVIESGAEFDRVEPGKPTAAAGKLAYEALKLATAHLQEQSIDALVTLPIDKATIQNPEFNFPGHTEYLAHQLNSRDSLMMMVYHQLRVAVATGHVPLNKVSSLLTKDRIYHKVRIFDQSLKVDFNIDKPKIAVLGLNPHAGDGGLIGQEEQDIILPALKRLQQEQLLVMGPYPADGFFAAQTYRKFDGILAMYHDQGLIPFKTLSESLGVNFTAGLSRVRTSPDHGTAYDIAGRNQADETSTRNAIYQAIDIWKTRQENESLRKGALKPIAVSELVGGEDSILVDED
jgi:4-hydroxythreonine-4-phosphate dehydrogenase